MADVKAVSQRDSQLQRMEAIQNLAKGLAHNFNNQLTVILGFAAQLAERTAGEERQLVHEIQQAARVSEAITRDLLRLGGQDLARPSRLDLHELIRSKCKVLRHVLPDSIDLDCNFGHEELAVFADSNHLRQSILNLALNARDAMPEGGAIRFETSEVMIGEETNLELQPGAYVKLVVSDTGRGMDEATLARVFEPMFTTKRNHEGSGLGMSVTHSLIHQAGGTIRAESELGKGSRFEIYLRTFGFSAFD